MSTEKNPQQKKESFYKHEHKPYAEFPHAFRKSWPKKKAKSKRAERRKVHQDMTNNIETKVSDEIELKNIKRKEVRKWGGDNIKDWIRGTKEKRIAMIARNYFKNTYDSKKHKEKFINFLNSIFEMKNGNAKLIAELFKTSLENDRIKLKPGSQQIMMLRIRNTWLKDFFEEVPEYKIKIEKWIENNV